LSPRPLATLKDPAAALASSVASYTGQAPMVHTACKRRIAVDEWDKRFADGRCLHCGGFNHTAAECAA